MKNIFIYTYCQNRSPIEMQAFEKKSSAIDYAISKITSLVSYEESKCFDLKNLPQEIVDIRNAILSHKKDGHEKVMLLWNDFIKNITGFAPLIHKIDETQLFTDTIKMNTLGANIADVINEAPPIRRNVQAAARLDEPVWIPVNANPPQEIGLFEEEEEVI
jgi:hypothetical protein